MALTDSTLRISSSTSTFDFFKVFVPKSGSHRMSIPPAFVKYFNGSIPSEAVLRDQRGKSWHVTLEELNNRVFFKNNWQEFVTSHFLGYGDFLVFQYDGNHLFDVKIFSKNGCKKEQVSRTDNLFPEVKIKDEIQSEKDLSASSNRCKRNDFEVRSSGSSGTASKSRKTLTTNLEEPGPSRTADHISTKPPTLELLVRHWSQKGIHIPKLVISTHNISLKPNVVIIDEMGRSWQVKVKPITRGRFSLTTGWPSFFKANSLKTGDICTIEFVLGSDNICGELNVKISRMEEITQHEN